MPSQTVRAWIYRVALVVFPVLVVYGVVNEQDVPMWIALVGAILVPGLAAANTSTKE